MRKMGREEFDGLVAGLFVRLRWESEGATEYGELFWIPYDAPGKAPAYELRLAVVRIPF